jgi:hypothetical protein
MPPPRHPGRRGEITTVDIGGELKKEGKKEGKLQRKERRGKIQGEIEV